MSVMSVKKEGIDSLRPGSSAHAPRRPAQLAGGKYAPAGPPLARAPPLPSQVHQLVLTQAQSDELKKLTAWIRMAERSRHNSPET